MTNFFWSHLPEIIDDVTDAASGKPLQPPILNTASGPRMPPAANANNATVPASVYAGEQTMAGAQQVSDVNERLDQLLLVCAAMWELLREKTSVSDDDLARKIAEIDARDGVADGKITPKAQPCAKCGRPVFPRHQRCIYCGCPRALDNIFKTI